MKIYTNYHTRPVVTLEDMPEKAQADFDYIEEEDRCSPRIVKYRDNYYDVGDMLYFNTMQCPGNPFGSFWHTGEAETYFSGILIHVCDDCENVIVGYYYQ